MRSQREKRLKMFASNLAQALAAMPRDRTIEQIAAEIKTSRAAIYDWLKAKREPSLFNARALADALGVTIEWLSRDSASLASSTEVGKFDLGSPGGDDVQKVFEELRLLRLQIRELTENQKQILNAMRRRVGRGKRGAKRRSGEPAG